MKIGFAFLFIFLYFLLLSFDGLRSYFTSDDGMNLVMLHGCFTEPVWRVAVDALQVCTAGYRPMGGLFYRAIYGMFHFDPLPFRVACYCILTLNLALAGLLLRCLSGLWEIAAIGTLLFSFHGMLNQLFYNTGTIYDLLCATFYLPAVLYYIYQRRSGLQWTFRQTAGLLALYACALDAKEMAASLPFTLLAYELLYFGLPTRWSPAVWKRFSAIGFVTTLTCVFAVAKLVLRSPMSANPLYRPSLSPHIVIHNLSWYYNMLVYRRDLFSPHTILPVVALMFFAAWLMRSRTMLFGLLFATSTMLPVLILPPRDGFVLYLPLIGWSLGAAVPLVRARLAIAGLVTRGSALPWAQTRMQAALLVGVAVLLYPIHQRKRNDLRFSIRMEQSEMRDTLEQMKRQFPTLPHHARILFVEDAFRQGDWGLSFLVRLQYADPTLYVARKKDLPGYSEQSKKDFRYVLAWENGMLRQIPN